VSAQFVIVHLECFCIGSIRNFVGSRQLLLFQRVVICCFVYLHF
jgi:hypothetical protein